MTFGELLDRVVAVTGLSNIEATDVTITLYDERVENYTEAAIQQAARILGLEEPVVMAVPKTTPMLELNRDRVLAEVYRAAPRCLPRREGSTLTYLPALGYTGSEDVTFYSPFYPEEYVRRQLEGVPEHQLRLVLGVYVAETYLNVTVYDRANDLERTIGPVDLALFSPGVEIREAVGMLLSRLPSMLRADWN